MALDFRASECRCSAMQLDVTPNSQLVTLHSELLSNDLTPSPPRCEPAGSMWGWVLGVGKFERRIGFENKGLTPPPASMSAPMV